MDHSCQAPLFMGSFRPEYWSGLPFSSPGDLPNTGIKPRCPALQADTLPSEPPGNPITHKQMGATMSQCNFICKSKQYFADPDAILKVLGVKFCPLLLGALYITDDQFNISE